MKVLFLYVSTNMCRDGTLWYYDEGAASVAACLRAAGHGVGFKMVGEATPYESVRSWVADELEPKTLLVFLTSLMFSAYGHDLPGTFATVENLRGEFGLPVAFVGLHATMNPEETMQRTCADFVGVGEMDEALVELCDALERGERPRGVGNFWIRDGDEVERNDLRPLQDDLSRLPFPARDLLPLDELANERDGILTIIALRGCPMDCNFCANPVLKRMYEGKGTFTRFKPVAYVIEEIRAARRANPALRGVFFHDDIFGLSPTWQAEFFERFADEVGMPFGCNLVISQAKPDFVRALREAGCVQVQIGIESGSPYLRNEIINKNIETEEIEAALALFRQAGIHVKFFAMMGLPEETRYRYRESARGFAELRPDMLQIQVWEAHEGSDLFESDRATGDLAAKHRDPAGDRRAWRLKFWFRHFHLFVALYEALADLRRTHPVRARLLSTLADALVLFPYTPALLLPRDWSGRRRAPSRLYSNRTFRRLFDRLLGSFWEDVLERERRLGSVYMLPEPTKDVPYPEGWVGHHRIDARDRMATPVGAAPRGKSDGSHLARLGRAAALLRRSAVPLLRRIAALFAELRLQADDVVQQFFDLERGPPDRDPHHLVLRVQLQMADVAGRARSGLGERPGLLLGGRLLEASVGVERQAAVELGGSLDGEGLDDASRSLSAILRLDRRLEARRHGGFGPALDDDLEAEARNTAVDPARAPLLALGVGVGLRRRTPPSPLLLLLRAVLRIDPHAYVVVRQRVRGPLVPAAPRTNLQPAVPRYESNRLVKADQLNIERSLQVRRRDRRNRVFGAKPAPGSPQDVATQCSLDRFPVDVHGDQVMLAERVAHPLGPDEGIPAVQTRPEGQDRQLELIVLVEGPGGDDHLEEPRNAPPAPLRRCAQSSAPGRGTPWCAERASAAGLHGKRTEPHPPPPPASPPLRRRHSPPARRRR